MYQHAAMGSAGALPVTGAATAAGLSALTVVWMSLAAFALIAVGAAVARTLPKFHRH